MKKSEIEDLREKRVYATQVACKRYEQIVGDIKLPKLNHLHKHLNFHSNIHFQENEGKKYKYQKYKRGAVVMVNFGTNLGNELSGHHFAIVLNKDDHSKNGVLTVVPLSSKNKKNYLKLNESIYSLILLAQEEYIKNLSDKKKKCHHYLQEIEKAKEKLHKNLTKLEKIASEPEEIIDIQTDKIIQILNNMDEQMEHIKVYRNYADKESIEIGNNIEKINKVLKTYTEKNKLSYVMIKNITTISKLKILKPINKFDPVGKIQISNSSLDTIDGEIKKYYTK